MRNVQGVANVPVEAIVHRIVRQWGPRAVGLLVTAIGLYVVAPSVIALLGQWPQLRGVKAGWFVVLIVLVVSSWVCLWILVRMLLPGTPWHTVGSAQLAGLASSCVLPGGSATGSVVQASVLVRGGNAAGPVAAALGSVGLLTTGMLLTLPVLTVPAVIIQPPPARQLELGLVVSLIVAVVLVLVGLALLHWDSLVHVVGRVAGRILRLVRRDTSVSEVADRVVEQRDQVAAAFAGRWGRALAAAAGNRMFDYAALVASVYAVGGRARPSMVLLAYVLSLALALIPITPGGLGFVEAGLTSILVLAGVDRDQAVIATLLYRLVSFWLPIPIGALAWTGWRFSAAGRPPNEPAAD
ncbi:MAG TPA: lysylphosphatidylglycerol synthase transmembrane domain-containing protein [Nocardioidaceae bacterium]|nr:lysylphosphatidylglycerol synthase transmembrane domain-containing protein [Nocardioidaceae bacterium]